MTNIFEKIQNFAKGNFTAQKKDFLYRRGEVFLRSFTCVIGTFQRSVYKKLFSGKKKKVFF